MREICWRVGIGGFAILSERRGLAKFRTTGQSSEKQILPPVGRQDDVIPSKPGWSARDLLLFRRPGYSNFTSSSVCRGQASRPRWAAAAAVVELERLNLVGLA